MTSILSCVVAAVALGSDPGLQGLPFGIPPAADDAAITCVAPPKCLFYINWAGTASPDPASKCETEKLLAEPEVQAMLNGIGQAFGDAKKAANAVQSLPSPWYLNDDVQYYPPERVSPKDVKFESDNKPTRKDHPRAMTAAEFIAQPRPDGSAVIPASSAPSSTSTSNPQKGTWWSAGSVDFCGIFVTHPTAIFVSDCKISQKTPESPAEFRGGAVVSLGADYDRLRANVKELVDDGNQQGVEGCFQKIKIQGETWYRTNPTKPGDKNLATFGFHGRYLVVGVGEGEVEGILARWNHPAPAWLTKTMEQSTVPRRTGIIYLDIKTLREKLPGSGNGSLLTNLGLDNIESLVSTTGLDDDGMVNRVLVAIDEKSHGLHEMLADRPMAAADSAPIPDNALLAFAARIDLAHSTDALFAAYARLLPANASESRAKLARFKKQYAPRFRAVFKAFGDMWCIYNSPTEGEVAFMGWTAVAQVRNRALLVASIEQLISRQDAKDEKERAAWDQALRSIFGSGIGTPRVEKCQFAGHEIYLLTGEVVAPALTISDHEAVFALNIPAMKAYLTRKGGHSLASLPSVKRSLAGPNAPAALFYCDTPKVFDCVYPVLTVYGIAGFAMARQSGLDLHPSYWPSAPAIRSHLRPEVTTLRRAPRGLDLMCRYSLPTGGFCGAIGLLAAELYAISPGLPRWPVIAPAYSGDPARGAQDSSPASRRVQRSQLPLNGRLPNVCHELELDDSGVNTVDAEVKLSSGTSEDMSQICFNGPKGLTIQWDVTATGRFDSKPLVAPARYKFPQGAVYRLKLANIPGRPGVEFFPTLEVGLTLPRTEAFLAHNAIPVEFTNEDFAEATKGNLVTKVVYLPDPEFQEPGVAGVGTIVSTRLDPGVDPIVEADGRGTILAIVRLKGREQPHAAGTGQTSAAISPDFQRKEKDAFWNHKRYDLLPVLGPLEPGSPEIGLDAPSEDEVMRALEKARPVQRSTPLRHETQRNHVRIVCEPIQDSVDPPRVVPLVGSVQVHHVHFKCIVYFKEITRSNSPVPHNKVTDDCEEVIYLDHDHLHRVGDAGNTLEKPTAAKK